MKKLSIKLNTVKNGFTLVEILLITGIISLACIGLYVIFSNASSTYTSNDESEKLFNAIYRLERASSASGVFTGINAGTFSLVGGFKSKLNVSDISSPQPDTLNLTYSGVSQGICSKFVTKISSGMDNLSARVNGTDIPRYSDPAGVGQSCSSDSNTVVAVLKSRISSAGLAPVTPSP